MQTKTKNTILIGGMVVIISLVAIVLLQMNQKDGKEVVRKMSVHEQFRLMGFHISRDLKECEINFAGQSYSQLSKRAGNGWDVNVVEILLKHIFTQL